MIEIYPLYEPEAEGMGPISYQARGHHDPDAFALDLEHGWGRTCATADVHHNHVRLVPCGPDGGMVQVSAEPGTRGAFAVTEVGAEDTRPVLRSRDELRARLVAEAVERAEKDTAPAGRPGDCAACPHPGSAHLDFSGLCTADGCPCVEHVAKETPCAE